MLSSYGITSCLIAIYVSGVAARPGPFATRAYFNTTFSSSTAASSSSVTTHTTLSLSSVDPTTSCSSTTSTSILSSSTSTTSSVIPGRILIITPSISNVIKTTTTSSSSSSSASIQSPSSPTASSSISSSNSSTVSSLTTSSSISSFFVTSGKNSSTTSTTYSTSSPIITPTTSSSQSLITSSATTSNPTATTQADCDPITTFNYHGSVCISYCNTQTYFSFAHNTTETVTQFITLFGNSTSLQRTQAPGPTSTLPPQPCFFPTAFQTHSSNGVTYTNTAAGTTAVVVSQAAPASTISLITSKTTVTSFVTASQSLSYKGAVIQDKSTVTPDIPGQQPTATPISPSSPLSPQSLEQATTPGPLKNKPTIKSTPVPPKTTRPSEQASSQIPNNPYTPTVTVNGVTVILPGSSVIIGSTTLAPNAGTTAITANGKVFTINPSQIIAPGTTVVRPTPNAGPTPTDIPTSTVIKGVTIAVGSSIAVIDSSTYKFGAGASPTTAIIHGQTVSVGPDGVGIGSTTLQPGSNSTPLPTQVATLGHAILTEIGSTLLLDGQTFTIGPNATPITVVINGQTYSIGPGGVGSGSTTIFQTQNASPGPTQVITAAGVTFSEIGSSVVVLGSQTFTLGAQATPTTEIINGQTVSIGPGGIGIAGATGTTTIAPPPATVQTKAITAGGITFSEIGSSLVVIGSSTFTMGPGATPTTDVFNGVTISIGPGGVGFASTTVAYVSPTAATGAVYVTTNGASDGRSSFSRFSFTLSVLGCVWALL